VGDFDAEATDVVFHGKMFDQEASEPPGGGEPSRPKKVRALGTIISDQRAGDGSMSAV
jgi:hypothetical protein